MRISKQFVDANMPHGDGISRANHDEYGCFGDSDSTVIRLENGRISAKCYRCGAWYVADSKTFNKTQSAVITPKRVDIASDCTLIRPDNTEAFEWLTKANESLTFWNNCGLRWSDSKESLYIPAVNSYQRWWAVRHYAKDSKTRYTTLAGRKDACFGMCKATSPKTDALFICEDLLSMYRLADAGADAIALCTTSISDKALAIVARLGYNKVRLCLDDDNRQVLLANHTISKRLGFVKDVCTAGWGKDPKYFDKQTLDGMIL